jgi:hypothetical protein
MKIFTFLMLVYLGISSAVFCADTANGEIVKILNLEHGYLAVKIGPNNTQTGLSPVTEDMFEAIEYAYVEVVKNKTPFWDNGIIINANTMIENLKNQGLLTTILQKIDKEYIKQFTKQTANIKSIDDFMACAEMLSKKIPELVRDEYIKLLNEHSEWLVKFYPNAFCNITECERLRNDSIVEVENLEIGKMYFAESYSSYISRKTNNVVIPRKVSEKNHNSSLCGDEYFLPIVKLCNGIIYHMGIPACAIGGGGKDEWSMRVGHSSSNSADYIELGN